MSLQRFTVDLLWASAAMVLCWLSLAWFLRARLQDVARISPYLACRAALPLLAISLIALRPAGSGAHSWVTLVWFAFIGTVIAAGAIWNRRKCGELTDTALLERIRARSKPQASVYVFEREPIEAGDALSGFSYSIVLPRALFERLSVNELVAVAAAQGGYPFLFMVPLMAVIAGIGYRPFWPLPAVACVALLHAAVVFIAPRFLTRYADRKAVRRPEHAEHLITALAKIHGDAARPRITAIARSANIPPERLAILLSAFSASPRLCGKSSPPLDPQNFT